MSQQLPGVHFGNENAANVKWRGADILDDVTDDDEELAETPPDVVAMLGFDPAKE